MPILRARRVVTLSPTQNEEWIVRQAIALLEKRIFKQHGLVDTLPSAVNYFRLRLVSRPNEVFAALFLDRRLHALAYEELSSGSIAETSVHFRHIVQRVLAHNAAALIVAHQHPSGATEPSSEDRRFTPALWELLRLIDVRLVDHLVIGRGRVFSFAQEGLLFPKN